MRHYFGNTGNDYPLDLEGMIRDVPSAQRRLTEEVDEARKFVEALPLGTHANTSRQMNVGYS